MDHHPTELEERLRRVLRLRAEGLGAMAAVPPKALRRARRKFARTIVVCVVALGLVGYGATLGIRAVTRPHPPIPAVPIPAGPLRIAVVASIPGEFAEAPLLQEVGAGARDAGSDLGVPVAVRTLGTLEQELHDGLQSAEARLLGDGYNVVIGLQVRGSDFGNPQDTTTTLAAFHPRALFVSLDDPEGVTGREPLNVLTVTLQVQEAAYLAGNLAALVLEQRGGPQLIGVIEGGPMVRSGGLAHQALEQADAYVGGFRAGAKAANPGIRFLYEFAGEALDAPCGDAARREVARGAQVVFALSGPCTESALREAGRVGALGVGVGRDWSSLGPFVLTSVIKHEDEAVLRTIEAIVNRDVPGVELRLGLAEGAVGLGAVSPTVPADIIARVEDVKGEVESGQISEIPIRRR